MLETHTFIQSITVLSYPISETYSNLLIFLRIMTFPTLRVLDSIYLTIGSYVLSCSQARIWNFHGNPLTSPSLNPTVAAP